VFVGLLFLAGLVIVALNPPRFTAKAPSELYNVDQKAVTDALNKLPSSYEDVKVPRTTPQVAKGPIATAPTAATPLGVDPATELEQAERVRVARLANQARESGVFFRLQLKAARRRDDAGDAKAIGEVKATTATSPLQPSDRTAMLALRRATSDDDTLASEPTDPTRKLAFLKSEPEKEIYNLHGLQTPISPYQLMAGNVISASHRPQFRSAGLCHRASDGARLRHADGATFAGAAGHASCRQVRQRLRLRPEAGPCRLAAADIPRRVVAPNRQPARHRHRRLRGHCRRGRPPYFEASERRSPRNGDERRKRTGLRQCQQSWRQRSAQGLA
jgi:hypothetical protein